MVDYDDELEFINTDPYRTAVHEASHAVIGRVTGMVCGPASILADDDSAGHHIVGDPWIVMGAWERRGKYRDPASVFRGRIMHAMAGAEGERLFFGDCPDGDGDDRIQVALMSEQIPIPRRTSDFDADLVHYLDRLRHRTSAMLRRHRSAVSRVADALLVQGTLLSDDIDRISEIPAPRHYPTIWDAFESDPVA